MVRNYTKTIAICLAALMLFASGVSAAEYTIKQMTPAVQAALEGRRDRYMTLQSLKQQGAIGENNQGYVTAFSNAGNARSVASAENADRRVIYRTIAEQNGLTGAMGTIEKVFAQTQRDNAAGGTKIQLANGTWTTK